MNLKKKTGFHCGLFITLTNLTTAVSNINVGFYQTAKVDFLTLLIAGESFKRNVIFKD